MCKEELDKIFVKPVCTYCGKHTPYLFAYVDGIGGICSDCGEYCTSCQDFMPDIIIEESGMCYWCEAGLHDNPPPMLCRQLRLSD